jgi:DNA polymerase-3 subunit beta
MKLNIARDALAPVLSRAAALPPKHTTIPILACARLAIDPEGFTVTTTDGTAWYSASVDSEPHGEPWAGCLDAAKASAFVGSLPSGSIIALSAGDSRLTIAGPGATARLGWLPAEDFPILSVKEPTANFEIDPAMLSTGVAFVEPCVSDEATRHYLQGAYIDPAGLLIALDGHRVAVFRFAEAMPPFAGVILPAPVLAMLPGLVRGFADAVTVSVSPRFVSFASAGAGWSLTTKVIDGTYPDWRRVIPERSKRPIVVESAAMRQAVARIAGMTRGARYPPNVRLSLDGAELSVSAVSEDATEIDSTVPALSGPDRALTGLRVTYLADALDVIRGDRLELHIRGEDGGQPVWVCGIGETETGTLVLPVRV